MIHALCINGNNLLGATVDFSVYELSAMLSTMQVWCERCVICLRSMIPYDGI